MMTPRQIERAVNAALGRLLPPLVQQLRDDLVADLRQHLPARDAAPEAPAKTAVAQSFAAMLDAAERCEVVVPGAAPMAATTAPAQAAGPWTVGEGSRRRLTEAGLARVAALLAEGKTDSQIAAEMRITRRAVQLRRNNGTESADTWATTPQPERDLARAEKNRQYQREWYRKKRAKGAAPAEVEPVVIGADLGSKPSVQVDVPVIVPEAQTVVVVPAAVVPAPKVPAAPVIIPATAAEPPDRLKAAPPPVSRAQAGGLATARLPRDPHSGRTIPTPAAPMDPAQLEPVPASYEDALDWLFAELTRQKMQPAEIETRLAAMSTKQLLAACNAQRIKAGLSPYVLRERAA